MKTYKNESPTEVLGHLSGNLIGPLVGTISLLRRARIFHPRGICFRARVEPLSDELRLHPYALVRLSGALWKGGAHEWPDVLGAALRFTGRFDITERPRIDDQDLLMASFDRPWKLLLSPFLTRQHDFMANEYWSVSPYHTENGRKVIFRLTPFTGKSYVGKREDKIRRAVNTKDSHPVQFVLSQRDIKSSHWTHVARLVFEEEIDIDQEALAFDPFLDGLGLVPAGFIQHLRIGAYRFSQWLRPRKNKFRSKSDVDAWTIVVQKQEE